MDEMFSVIRERIATLTREVLDHSRKAGGNPRRMAIELYPVKKDA